MAKTKQTETCISVANGDFFDYLSPETHEYSIDVIAHALSNLCRYGGHSRRFYSVAEHSVVVSHLVPSRYALVGLLHDASEAYCGDVASPLKRLIPDYRRIEDRVQEAIANHFNLPFPFPKEVHVADKRAYLTERRMITDGTDALWHTEFKPSSKVKIVGFTPAQAKSLFLNRYKELTNVKEKGTKRIRGENQATDAAYKPHPERLAFPEVSSTDHRKAFAA